MNIPVEVTPMNILDILGKVIISHYVTFALTWIEK